MNFLLLKEAQLLKAQTFKEACDFESTNAFPLFLSSSLIREKNRGKITRNTISSEDLSRLRLGVPEMEHSY